MKDINFVKNIDSLGRIVIPMDIRKKLQINTGDVLSITCNDKNILLCKYSTLSDNYKVIEIIKCFVENFNLKVILMDKDYVIYSNLVNINSKIDSNLKVLIKDGYKLRNEINEFNFDGVGVKGSFNMLPIISSQGIIGSLLVMGDVFDRGYEFCDILTKIISLELNIS